MKQLKVSLARDHIDRFATGRKPTSALAELLWNSLDADSTDITVSFERDVLSTITCIEVVDNGRGISDTDGLDGFRQLGGSWKRNQHRTKSGRQLHGKAGQGRFMAFNLGFDVEWISVFGDEADRRKELTIRGSFEDILEFTSTGPIKAAGNPRGTKVRIVNVREDATQLLTVAAHDELTEKFALYLRQYPDIKVTVNGTDLNPKQLTQMSKQVKLPALKIGNMTIKDLVLDIVVWKKPRSRTLHYCDANGFTVHTTTLGLRSHGIDYSAYLSSSYIQNLADTNEFVLENLSDGVRLITDAARNEIREFIREEHATSAAGLVTQWKEEGIYPFKEDAKTPTEIGERQVFDILAMNVNTYAPEFNKADRKTKHLSFQLMRQALESQPSSMSRILGEVLGLSVTKRDELADLLDKTSLSSIISATKEIADRLNMVRTLETLIYDPKIRTSVLERQQLHKILANNAWIFGEQFHLSVNDKSLTDALRQHLSIVRPEERKRKKKDDFEPVTLLDGSTAIIDMMLSKTTSHGDGSDRQHVVVELKRPTQKIDSTVVQQTLDYAMAVSGDSRFHGVRARWQFWAISTEIDSSVEQLRKQKHNPPGVAYALENDVNVMVKSWSEILEECRGRLKFFEKQLDYSVSTAGALADVAQTYGKYFPSVVQNAFPLAAAAN